MRTIEITSPSLPGATFTSIEALREFVGDRIAYDAAVAEFVTARDEETLAERLAALGYDEAEIAWHIARPGERMQEMFANATDLD